MAILLIIAATDVFYNWLILSGDEGISVVTYARYNAFGQLGDKEIVAIPEVYYQVSAWVNEQREREGFFRTLWLPIDRNIKTKIQTLDPYTLFPIKGQNRGSDNLTRGIFDKILQRDTEISYLLSMARVKYLVVIKTTQYTGELRRGWTGEGIVGDPAHFISILESDTNLQEVLDISDYTIFENTLFRPLFYLCEHLALVISQNSHVQELFDDLGYLPSHLLDRTMFITQSSENVIDERLLQHTSNLVVLNSTSTAFDGLFDSIRHITLVNEMESFWDSNKVASVPINVTELQWNKAFYDTVDRINYTFPDGEESKVIRFGVNETKSCVHFFITDLEDRTWQDIDYLTFRFLGNLSSATNSVILQIFDAEGGRADWKLASYVKTNEWEEVAIDFRNPDGGVYGFNYSLPIQTLRFRVQTDGNGEGIRFVFLDKINALFTKSKLVEEKNASNDHIIELRKNQTFVSEIEVPKQDNYQMLIRIQNPSVPTIEMNNREVNAAFLPEEGRNGFGWLRTESIELPEGSQLLSVTSRENWMKMDLMILTNYPDESPKNFNGSIQIKSATPYGYKMEAIIDTPAFLEFGDSYHDLWGAYSGNHSLLHFNSGQWANGFLLEPGFNTVKIEFAEQKIRDISITIGAVAWSGILFALVYILLTKRKA